VAPGQRADVVFLDANPLSDITNSQRILPRGRLAEF